MERVKKKIQMVDLGSQYQKIKPEIDAAIQQVIDSTFFINGPEVRAFASDLGKHLGVNHVIPCANGTDALQIAMMALGLQPGDEVITADFTYVATAEVIALLGLKPVLVDVHPDTFLIDVNAVEKAITSKTKAIVPVHLFGQCADMERIMDLSVKYGFFVVEDAAQSINATYTFSDGRQKKAGTIGTIGCTSFFPSKNLGCFGDGGALFTDREEIAATCRMIANHGQSVQYYHDAIGVNSRLDSIQAAVLRVKLRHLDEYTCARVNAAGYYDKAFEGNYRIQTPVRVENSSHVFHQYTLLLRDTDRLELKQFLAAREIPAMIYYPVPLHKQKAYRDPRNKNGDYPVTDKVCNSVLSLPMHTELTAESLDYICTSVLEFVK